MKQISMLLLIAALLFTGCAKVNVNVDDYEKYWKSSDAEPVSLDPAVEQRQQKIDELNQKVLELYREKKYDRAEDVLQALVEIDPDAGHWYNLACLQALQGKEEKALASLGRAVQAGYANPRQLTEDDDLESIRQSKQFSQLFEQVRKQARRKEAQQKQRQTEQFRLHRRMMAAFKAGEFNQARQLAARVVKLDPDNGIAWYNLACAESRLGNTPEALSALNRAIDEGYLAFRHMEKDPDLANIRDTEGYRGILVKRQNLLRTNAEKVLSDLRAQLGEDYLFEIDHKQKLIYATNIDRRMLNDLKAYLGSYARAQRRWLFDHEFEQYVSIVLPKQWNLRGIGGLYNPSKRMLTARSLGMVMTHEFTHALHFGDQEGRGQQHPIWITEGLATLFESSRIEDGSVVPQPNYRLLLLKQRAQRDRLLDLKTLTDFSHRDFMKRAAIAYAQSRYLLFYLYDQDKLQAFYDNYTAGYDDDPSGAKALSTTLGKDLDEIQEDFRTWVIAQKAPPLRLRPNQAYIGIRMQPVKDGLEIVQAVPGSGAAKAGLSPGDVVVKVDEHRVVDSSDLLSIVSASDVGDKLQLEIRRDGKYKQVEVTLTAMPQQLPRSRRE
ncbi:MAG: TPR end-of-group domain-containing protein [Phycisphaerae bacterium]